MNPLEAAAACTVVAATVIFVIRFVLRQGRADAQLRAFALALMFALVYLGRIVPLGLKVGIFIGYAACVYMLATDFLERSLTRQDFLRYYNPKWLAFISLSLMAFPVRRLAAHFEYRDAAYLVLLAALGLGYTRLTRHMPGAVRAFQGYTVFVALGWLGLMALVAAGDLYSVEALPEGIRIRPRVLTEDGLLDLGALNRAAAILIEPYGAGIVWSFWFIVYGVAYHGLLKPKARRAAIRGCAVMLVIVTYAMFPDWRALFRSIPIIGQYAASPLLLLGALAAVTGLFLVELTRSASGPNGR